MKSNSKSGLLVAIALVAAFLLAFYGPVFRAPNEVLFGNSPDALKNYFTPWYHIKYDESYSWFSGMNYPWGEHVTFTDCQPLVSNTLKFISNHVVDISDNTVGILNLLMLLSILPTAMFLWAILRRLGVDSVYAGVAGAGIALLSPQLLRILGHYALSYSFIIPMVWYLWLRQFQKSTWLSSVFIATVVFLSGWIHPYYLSITSFFLLALWLSVFFTLRMKSNLKNILTHTFIQAILPVALFQLSIWLTDPVTDRPGNPFGLTDYVSNVWSFILPLSLHFFEGVEKIPALAPDPEGLAYLGFAAILIFIFLTFRMVKRIALPGKFIADQNWKKRYFTHWSRKLRPSLSPAVSISILAGILILILACGYPFKLKPSLLTDLFPPIKQFRSLGRFSWVFYFTWVTASFYFIWAFAKRLRQKNRKTLALFVQWVPVVILLTESGLYHYGKINESHFRKNPVLSDSQLNHPQNEWMKKINPPDYSAVLFLPFFHTGSENGGSGTNILMNAAFKASLETGLPMMDVMMSRTSLNQTWKLLQLVSNRYRPLEIIPQLKNPKPILIVEKTGEYQYKGSAILPFAEKIFSNAEINLYSITIEQLKKAGAPFSRTEIEECIPADTIYTFHGLYCNQPDPLLQVIQYDETASAPSYSGKGALHPNRQHGTYLFKEKIKAPAGRKIFFSFWLRMREDNVANTLFGIEEYDAGGKNTRWDFEDCDRFAQVMDSQWVLTEREYAVRDSTFTAAVTVVRWNSKAKYIDVDEFLLRPELVHLFGKRDGKFYFDNRFFHFENPADWDSLLKTKTIIDWK